MTFEEWFERKLQSLENEDFVNCLKLAWDAAVKEEREKFRASVKEASNNYVLTDE